MKVKRMSLVLMSCMLITQISACGTSNDKSESQTKESESITDGTEQEVNQDTEMETNSNVHVAERSMDTTYYHKEYWLPSFESLTGITGLSKGWITTNRPNDDGTPYSLDEYYNDTTIDENGFTTHAGESIGINYLEFQNDGSKYTSCTEYGKIMITDQLIVDNQITYFDNGLMATEAIRGYTDSEIAYVNYQYNLDDYGRILSYVESSTGMYNYEYDVVCDYDENGCFSYIGDSDTYYSYTYKLIGDFYFIDTIEEFSNEEGSDYYKWYTFTYDEAGNLVEYNITQHYLDDDFEDIVDNYTVTGWDFPENPQEGDEVHIVFTDTNNGYDVNLDLRYYANRA